jgi:hypothetical protein
MSDVQGSGNYGIFGQVFDATSVKVQSEFQANEYPSQDLPVVSNLSNGNFIIVWYGPGAGDPISGIYGQLFNSVGSKMGNNFLINTITTGSQGKPSIASFTNGDFVVTWDNGGGGDIHGQLFTSNGNKIEDQFLINTDSYDTKERPSVAALSSNQFAVCWGSNLQDGSGYGVYGQIFSYTSQLTSTPNPTSTQALTPILTPAQSPTSIYTSSPLPSQIGNAFQISENLYVPASGGRDICNYQIPQSVLTLSDGNLLVTWDIQTSSDFEVMRGPYAQKLSPAGSKIDNEFLFNNVSNTFYDIAVISNENLVAAYSATVNSRYDIIQAQRFTSTGNKVGNAFQVYTNTIGMQSRTAVATTSNGNFMVVWDKLLPTDKISSKGVYGRIFNSDGAPVSGEFKINQRAAASAYEFIGHPRLYSLQNGNFMAVWNDFTFLPTGYSEDAQIFSATGSKIGSIFTLYSYAYDEIFKSRSNIAILNNGNFVAVWEFCPPVKSASMICDPLDPNGPDGSGCGIFGQLFTSTGDIASEEFQMNTYSKGTQISSKVATLSNGNFIVVWRSYFADTAKTCENLALDYESYGSALYGQTFLSNGTKRGNEFQIHTFGENNNPDVHIEPLDNNNVAVIWSGSIENCTKYGVFGTIFDANAIGQAGGGPVISSANQLSPFPFYSSIKWLFSEIKDTAKELFNNIVINNPPRLIEKDVEEVTEDKLNEIDLFQGKINNAKLENMSRKLNQFGLFNTSSVLMTNSHNSEAGLILSNSLNLLSK